MQYIIFIAIIYILVKSTRAKKVEKVGFATNEIKKTTPSLPSKDYKLYYTDQKKTETIKGVIYSEILHSEKYDMRGKPDYIFINNKKTDLIPVELKSGKIGAGTMPYEGDLMQLVAYFLIIEDIFNVIPLEGRLIYSDYMFIVKNSKSLRMQLIDILNDMRDMLKTGEDEPKASFSKCKHCMCRDTVCEFCNKKAVIH